MGVWRKATFDHLRLRHPVRSSTACERARRYDAAQTLLTGPLPLPLRRLQTRIPSSGNTGIITEQRSRSWAGYATAIVGVPTWTPAYWPMQRG